MPRTVAPPFPGAARQLAALGERLRLARKRRRLSAALMAERVGISRDTLHRLERGEAAVSLGTCLRVLRVLGLDTDLDRLAADDVLGLKLQDLGLDKPGRPRFGRIEAYEPDDGPLSGRVMAAIKKMAPQGDYKPTRSLFKGARVEAVRGTKRRG